MTTYADPFQRRLRDPEPIELSAEERVQKVLDALSDPDCRAILEAVGDGPLTAPEIEDRLDLSTSTTYRKLDLLADAGLVAQGTRMNPKNKPATEYDLAFGEITFQRDGDGSITVDLAPPEDTPSGRLADIWTEVRRETR